MPTSTPLTTTYVFRPHMFCCVYFSIHQALSPEQHFFSDIQSSGPPLSSTSPTSPTSSTSSFFPQHPSLFFFITLLFFLVLFLVLHPCLITPTLLNILFTLFTIPIMGMLPGTTPGTPPGPTALSTRTTSTPMGWTTLPTTTM